MTAGMFGLGLVAAILVAFVCFIQVQRKGNYETWWGAGMLWTLPVYLAIALPLLVF